MSEEVKVYNMRETKAKWTERECCITRIKEFAGWIVADRVSYSGERSAGNCGDSSEWSAGSGAEQRAIFTGEPGSSAGIVTDGASVAEDGGHFRS